LLLVALVAEVITLVAEAVLVVLGLEALVFLLEPLTQLLLVVAVEVEVMHPKDFRGVILFFLL
jgi:hypothetical protein